MSDSDKTNRINASETKLATLESTLNRMEVDLRSIKDTTDDLKEDMAVVKTNVPRIDKLDDRVEGLEKIVTELRVRNARLVGMLMGAGVIGGGAGAGLANFIGGF